MMVDNKIFFICIFLISLIGSYFIVGNLIYSEDEVIYFDDNRFNEIVKEVEQYDGAMVVTYDTETGEILGKRKLGEPRESGVMSVSESEYKQNKNSLPLDVVIIPDDLTTLEVLELMVGNNGS